MWGQASERGETGETLQAGGTGDVTATIARDEPAGATRSSRLATEAADPRSRGHVPTVPDRRAQGKLHGTLDMRIVSTVNRQRFSAESKKKLRRPCREARALER